MSIAQTCGVVGELPETVQQDMTNACSPYQPSPSLNTSPFLSPHSNDEKDRLAPFVPSLRLFFILFYSLLPHSLIVPSLLNTCGIAIYHAAAALPSCGRIP